MLLFLQLFVFLILLSTALVISRWSAIDFGGGDPSEFCWGYHIMLYFQSLSGLFMMDLYNSCRCFTTNFAWESYSFKDLVPGWVYHLPRFFSMLCVSILLCTQNLPILLLFHWISPTAIFLHYGLEQCLVVSHFHCLCLVVYNLEHPQQMCQMCQMSNFWHI